jgi:sarcosine oxidase subunit delta
MRIRCPHCGERDHTEFTYGADATLQRPAADDTGHDAWMSYVYDRDNPRGPYWEFWQHSAGCHLWFKVLRDTLTHEIIDYAAADQPVSHGLKADGSAAGGSGA